MGVVAKLKPITNNEKHHLNLRPLDCREKGDWPFFFSAITVPSVPPKRFFDG